MIQKSRLIIFYGVHIRILIKKNLNLRDLEILILNHFWDLNKTGNCFNASSFCTTISNDFKKTKGKEKKEKFANMLCTEGGGAII